MNKYSLIDELNTLKSYLNSIENKQLDLNERKIASHTIIGMIITINTLISTGAYNQDNHSGDLLFSLIDQARNTVLHYGYFNEYSNIYPDANLIINNIPQSLNSNFAEKVNDINLNIQNDYHMTMINNNIEISLLNNNNDLVLLRNKINDEQLYISKKDLLIITNQIDSNRIYLINKSNDAIFFYKKNVISPTEKVDFNFIEESSFSKEFTSCKKKIKIKDNLNLILNAFKENKYNNSVVTFKYDNKQYYLTPYNLIRKMINYRVIDERIVEGKFILTDSTKHISTPEVDISTIDFSKIINLVKVEDIFFIELFLKRYKNYLNILEENPNLSLYAKQSMLLNLYQVGARDISDNFYQLDDSKQLKKLHVAYMQLRKTLSHSPILDKEEKSTLIHDLEKTCNIFYDIFKSIYNKYSNKKKGEPFSNLPSPKKIDNRTSFISSKTSTHLLINHKGKTKMIDDKKYIQLDDNEYLDIERAILLLDYITLSSSKCLVPLNGLKTIKLDNENNPHKSKLEINKYPIVTADTTSSILLNANDYIRSHPCYNEDENFVVITFFNSKGEAVLTEGIKNLIYRRHSQKIQPELLVDITNLIIPSNLNEPLTLTNNQNVIAKIYLATIDQDHQIKQVLINNKQKEIDYGILLEKDLMTDSITNAKKEVFNNEKRNRISL